MGRPKGSINKAKIDKPKPITTLKADEKGDYRKLTDYLQEVYLNTVGYDPPWQLFMTQIKDIKKSYDIDYAKILQILKYMIQIEGIDITERDTLGLVPYYINKTDKYIADYSSARKAIKEFKYDEKTIVIKPSKQAQRKHKKNEVFD